MIYGTGDAMLGLNVRFDSHGAHDPFHRLADLVVGSGGAGGNSDG